MDKFDVHTAMEAALRRLQSPQGDVIAWRDQVLAELGISHDEFRRVAPLCDDFIASHANDLRGPLAGALLLGFLFGSVLSRQAA